jgi:hypothetical protein
MTIQSSGPVVRAADNPRPADNPNPHPRDGSEANFAKLLDSLGWDYAWEAVTFPGLPPAKTGGPARAFTPDVKLISFNGQKLSEPVYLELTEPDRYHSARALPKDIRRKNKRSSQSQREFIPAVEYLARKSIKIDDAIRIHKIRVILLPYKLQLRIFKNPSLLLELAEAAARADPAPLSLAPSTERPLSA